MIDTDELIVSIERHLSSSPEVHRRHVEEGLGETAADLLASIADSLRRIAAALERGR